MYDNSLIFSLLLSSGIFIVWFTSLS